MKVATFLAIGCTSFLCALPTGGRIIRGEARLESSVDALQIHANGKAIVEWDRFNIASHETVHFTQMQNRSAILNRVAFGSASEILGTLKADCPIYLVNPQGVFIGSTALIDTAGFLASTSDVSNDSFWQGQQLFFQELKEGEILNLGRVSATDGDVVFIARSVDNRGRIEAESGSAILVTHEIVLHPDTKRSVFIRVEEPIQETEGIQNSGTIQALAVELKTLSPYEKAIEHRGSIAALSTVESNGRIYLVADRGGCVIDAPLTAAAGVIDVAANTVHVTKQAVLNVSSEGEGNGGNIQLTAERQLIFHGLAEARGGIQGGDGGTIHLSSKGLLDSRGFRVDASALKGRSGQLLFDPKFVAISPEGLDPAAGNTFGSNPSGSATISGLDLQTALDSASVVIQANTDIVFQDTVATSTAGSSLTLQAGRSIQFDGELTLNAGDFTATINDSGASAPDRDSGVAGFQLSNLASIATQGGNIALDVGTFGDIQEGEIFINGATLDAGGGDLTITGIARQDGSDNAYGIFVGMDSLLQTTGAGTLSLSGTGGNGANRSAGVNLSGGQLQTDAGLLTLIGHGGGDGTGIGAVGIYSAAQVGSIGNGAIVFQGFGGDGVHGNMGIYLSGGQISTLDGDITLQGTGSGTGALNFGIRLESNAQCVSSGAGVLTLSGTSGQGKNNNHGVILAGSSLSANTGAISVTGIGRGSVDYNYGIRFESDSSCISTGTAPISLDGQNSFGRNGNAGVSIYTSGIAISSGYGDIQISGTSSGSAILNQGIRLESGQIVSTGTGSGAANMHLIGVGGMGTNFCNGIAIQGFGGDAPLFGTVVTSIDGNIVLEGTSGGSGLGNQAFDIDPSSLIDTTGSGMIMYIEH